MEWFKIIGIHEVWHILRFIQIHLHFVSNELQIQF